MHRGWLALLVVALSPTLAFAHAGHAGTGGWAGGFAHPFQGWDHMVVMVAVGLWAAQSARASIVVAFMGMMAAGTVSAIAGLSLPIAESVILASTVVAAATALINPSIGLRLALPVVAVFGFFHGFAHGSEMPAGDSVGFIAGVLAATLLLHSAGFAAGFAVMRAKAHLSTGGTPARVRVRTRRDGAT